MATIYPATASRPAANLSVTLARAAFSYPALLGALLFAAALKCSLFLVMDVDAWWHMAVGERILATGTWPTKDIYSFTVPGSPWIAYEWLTEVAMALAARAASLTGLTALLIALSGLLVLLLYSYATLRSRNPKAAFLACVLILPLLAPFFTLRAQLFGYIFLLITLICLELFRQGRTKAVWALPGIFLVWVNTHGSFALGLAILGLYWVSGLVNFRWGGLVAEPWTAMQRRQLLLVILLCVLVLPLTPYGTRLAAYPFEMALLQPVNVGNIEEWQPIGFGQWWGKLFLGCLLVFFLAQVIFQPAARLAESSLLLGAICAACVHRRFVLLFGLVFVPWLASLLARWVTQYQREKDRYALNAVLLLVILAGVAWLYPSRQGIERLVAGQFPQRAVEYLRQNPAPGRVFNEFRWGGYLIWQLPQQKVFIDGRTDIYEHAGVLADYLHITRLERDALFLLRKYNVQACLLEPKAPLSVALATLPDWQRVYQDERSVVFARQQTDAVEKGNLPVAK